MARVALSVVRPGLDPSFTVRIHRPSPYRVHRPSFVCPPIRIINGTVKRRWKIQYPELCGMVSWFVNPNIPL